MIAGPNIPSAPKCQGLRDVQWDVVSEMSGGRILIVKCFKMRGHGNPRCEGNVSNGTGSK